MNNNQRGREEDDYGESAEMKEESTVKQHKNGNKPRRERKWATNDCVNIFLSFQPHQKHLTLHSHDFMLHFLSL